MGCNGSIVKTSSIKPDGSHEFEHQPKMSLDIYECIKSIKRRIEEEPTAPVSLLYDKQVKKFRRENGTAASIPVFDRVKSSLYEYWTSKQPPVPKLDQNFLLCNNQIVSVVGFASSIGIKLLGDNAHWNADGTFRTAPKLFYQSYSIHIWDKFSMKPVIYTALPNKNTNTISGFFEKLSNGKNKGVPISFWSKYLATNKKKGLVSYSHDDEARRQIANILMLPLLPPQEIIIAFTDIIECISNVNQIFLKLADYILHAYIEDALFPPSFWNLFDLIGSRPRTNNHVEGFHGQLNSHCQSHPNLWAWIRYIQESEESIMVRVEQEEAQQRTTRPRRVKSVRNDNILIQAKEEYLNGLLDLSGYQRRLRPTFYRYIKLFDTTDKDDLDYQPNS
ncbi:unnamed protein product [Rotaria magnacalcarata]|uniref:MULE transposase domain-containing protein n=3 Tax=Rotaria TaxID=231623 RepID=A0A8S3D060_9BILA|nr:unnamed protein product [Rotaria magnacalcarata]